MKGIEPESNISRSQCIEKGSIGDESTAISSQIFDNQVDSYVSSPLEGMKQPKISLDVYSSMSKKNINKATEESSSINKNGWNPSSSRSSAHESSAQKAELGKIFDTEPNVIAFGDRLQTTCSLEGK